MLREGRNRGYAVEGEPRLRCGQSAIDVLDVFHALVVQPVFQSLYALRYRGEWSGAISLQDADIPFEAFAEPLHIVSADATIDGAALTLKRVSLSIGGIDALGEYRYEADAPRPHRFRIMVPEMSGPELERVLMPTLHRGNLLTYAFNFGRAPQPDWLRNMKADGIIQAGQIDVSGGRFANMRARVVWEGTEATATVVVPRDLGQCNCARNAARRQCLSNCNRGRCAGVAAAQNQCVAFRALVLVDKYLC